MSSKNNAKTEAGSNLPQYGHQVDSGGQRSHLSQETVASASPHDAAPKAAENTVQKTSLSVSFGHSPTLDDAVGDQAASFQSTGNSTRPTGLPFPALHAVVEAEAEVEEEEI